MKVPPHKAESVYNAVAVFTLPKSYLERGAAFYLAARDDSIKSMHAMPNSVVGFTEIVDDSLQKLYYAKEVKSARIPVQWSDESKVKPLFSNSRCHVELACIEADENPIEHSRASSIKSTRKIPRTPDMGVSMTDKSKWDLLSKELA